MKKLLVHWSNTEETRRNFGDALNFPLLDRLTSCSVVHAGDPVAFRSPFKPILVGMGSILESAKFIERIRGGNLYVWGSGSKGRLVSCSHLKKAKFCSVRGPLTRNLLLSLGVKDVPEIYGDPALLVPSIWNEIDIGPRDGPVLVIPHYTELGVAENILGAQASREYKILDPRSPIDYVINAVANAPAILSSSLHGLILADAYGISNSWVSFGDRVGGGRFKFDDHHLGFWGRRRRKIIIVSATDVDFAYQNIESPPEIDTQPIRDSFPFKLLQ